jgi:hypothetical protein
MKRQIVSILGVFGLLLVAACANAQSVKVTANVPFDFVVDKATLPAGAYSIDEMTHGSAALAIRNQDSGAARMELANHANSLNASPDTRLVFHRYGERYFLSQIWVAGETSGREFTISKREAEMAKNSQPVENVIVLAELR